MREDVIELIRAVRKLHVQTHIKLNELREVLKTCHDESESVDIAYAMNEAFKWSDEIRKQFKSVHEMSERVTCLVLVAKGHGSSVKTAYCSATPRVKQIATIPKKSTQPEEFAKLMNFLGIRKELWENEDDDEVVRIHWPGIVAHLTALQAAGKPLPPGIDPQKTYPVFALTIRPTKGVLSTEA